MTEKKQCCARVYGSGRLFGGEKCSNVAKSEHAGQWYCHVHHPEKVKERRAKQLAHYNGKWAAEKAQRDKAEAQRAHERHCASVHDELVNALEMMVEAECDYMRINNLGDPEKQHNVKVARAALAKARGET